MKIEKFPFPALVATLITQHAGLIVTLRNNICSETPVESCLGNRLSWLRFVVFYSNSPGKFPGSTSLISSAG